MAQGRAAEKSVAALAIAAGIGAGCAAVAGLDGYAIVDCPSGSCDGGPIGDAAGAVTDGAPPRDSASPSRDAAVNRCAACGPEASRQVCVDGGCASARRVFVTSAAFNANLDGASGADARCATIARDAKLGGTWRAWLSDGPSSPRERFDRSTGPYRLLDGTLVATSFDDLTDGDLASAINLDERSQVVAQAEVWTGTNRNGQSAGPGCAGFRSSAHAAGRANVGVTNRRDDGWTEVYEQFCDRTDPRLYCFEQ